MKQYFVYIVSNYTKTTIYIGVTNDLCQRVLEHYINRGKSKTFAGRNNCFYLIYYEIFENVQDAIDREKEIKRWRRAKKDELIASENPKWNFLNDEIFEVWPHSKDEQSSRTD